MKKARIITVLVIIGILPAIACSRIIPATMADGQPAVYEVSKGEPVGLVQDRSAPGTSGESPAAVREKEEAPSVSAKGVIAEPVQEKERDFSGTMHHWMALLAMKNNDINDANRHLQDAMAFINEPKHAVEMQKIMAMIAKRDLYNAEHGIEEMAGGESLSRIKVQRYHLQSTGKSLEIKDFSAVKRHMEDFMADATDKQRVIALELLQKAEKGDFRGAEYALVELIKR